MDLTHNPTGQLSFKGFCDHCGNISFQAIVVLEVSSSEGRPTTYTLSKCTICEGIALREHPGDWNAPLGRGDEPSSRDIPFEPLWPSSGSFSSDVPERIRSIYEEARLVRRQSPSSFVVQLRRAFEALTKERGAEGRTLYAQIQWLIDNGQLPSLFAEMINITRMIGNLGAHDAEREVTAMDVEVSDQFFKAIVEYLYIAPAFLANVKKASHSSEEPRPSA